MERGEGEEGRGGGMERGKEGGGGGREKGGREEGRGREQSDSAGRSHLKGLSATLKIPPPHPTVV